MSQKEVIPITCPICGRIHPFTIWPSINTKHNPEMKEKIRDLSSFEFICPKCGIKNIVSYDFLYHQAEDNYKIFCTKTDTVYEDTLKMLNEEDHFKAIDNKDPFKKIFNKFGKDMFNTNNTRIVRNTNEFLEKLYILDDKLDDRIIEFMKFTISLRFMDGVSKIHESINIFYTPSDNKELVFEIFVDGKFKDRIVLPKKTYNAFNSLYKSYFSIINADSYEINQNWVRQTQEKIDDYEDGLIVGLADD